MKIVCTASLLQAHEAFSSLGDVDILPDREIRREHLLHANALIVRSKTHVNRELLEGTPVEFVATATAGADHFDIPYLNAAEIVWSASPGCNANAVAEYVITAVTQLAKRHTALLAGRTLGIVGVGQVGSRVAQKASLMGLKVLRNDPPLALRTSDPDLLSLEAVLAEADMLTLHTPLESDGPFPTRHLANCRLFDQLKPGAWFLNTSRGSVTDSESLQCALDHHQLSACTLDVWEHEPQLPSSLQVAVDFLTPHIAGYSLEGLLNGTQQCYREFCHFLEREPTWSPDPRLLPDSPFLSIEAAHRTDEDVLSELFAQACPLPDDDREWRAEMTTTDPVELRHRFDRFRKRHLTRREFASIRIHLSHATPALTERIAAFGFQVYAQQS